jgi:CHASE3 domain sensor protein
MNSMIDRKSIQGFSIVAVIVLIIVATLPNGTTALNAQAQNADTSQQIRKYLIQAIQALDSG